MRTYRLPTFITLGVLFALLVIAQLDKSSFVLVSTMFMSTALWLRHYTIVALESQEYVDVSNYGRQALFWLIAWWMVKFMLASAAYFGILPDPYAVWAHTGTVIATLFELSYGTVLLVLTIWCVGTWLVRTTFPSFYSLLMAVTGFVVFLTAGKSLVSGDTVGNPILLAWTTVLSITAYICLREAIDNGSLLLKARGEYETWLAITVTLCMLAVIVPLPDIMTKLELFGTGSFLLSFILAVLSSFSPTKPQEDHLTYEEIIERQNKQ